MKTSYVFLAPGFEEIEAVAPIDIMRRAGMPVTTVAIDPSRTTVIGAHGVPYIADMTIAQLPANVDAEWLILPGGMPGATNLAECQPLVEILKNFPGNIAAICASPAVVLAQTGLLDGKKATCYPGMEGYGPWCSKVSFTGSHVERDGRFVTGQGPAWAVAFGGAIVEISMGSEVAEKVLDGMLVPSACRR